MRLMSEKYNSVLVGFAWKELLCVSWNFTEIEGTKKLHANLPTSRSGKLRV